MGKDTLADDMSSFFETQEASAKELTVKAKSAPTELEIKSGKDSDVAVLDRQFSAPIANSVASEVYEKNTRHVMRKLSGQGLLIELIDPNSIWISSLADRDASFIDDPQFQEDKQSVEKGGQDVPIKVRPSTNGIKPYELVYGNRRTIICQQLGIQVKAIIEDLTDVELVRQKYNENERHNQLSAIEKGRAYQSWIDQGVFGSAVELYTELNISKGTYSQYKAISKIHLLITRALGRCYKDLSYRDALRLASASKDLDENRIQNVLEHIENNCQTSWSGVKKLNSVIEFLSPKEKTQDRKVFDQLPNDLTISGMRAATVTKDKGQVVFRFAGDLSPAMLENAWKAVAKSLGVDASEIEQS